MFAAAACSTTRAGDDPGVTSPSRPLQIGRAKMGGRGRAEGSEGTPGRKKRRQKQGSPPQVGDEITTELDSYSLLEPIGEGTFSVVFKARAKKKDHGHAIVAAKILKDGQSDYSRVHQEYLCLAALKGHENVVEVLDGCSDGCRITLLMPYFEHGDFGESLHNGDFTDVHISCYMRGLFAALVHVHREGFIHRDIKPTNVLYNFESRRTMVVDFGLVQTREQASQIQSAAAPRDSHAGSPRNRASRPPAAAAGAEASRGSVARGARGATTTTTTTTTTTMTTTTTTTTEATAATTTMTTTTTRRRRTTSEAALSSLSTLRSTALEVVGLTTIYDM